MPRTTYTSNRICMTSKNYKALNYITYFNNNKKVYYINIYTKSRKNSNALDN